MNVEKAKAEATRRIRSMDEIDRKRGAATPKEKGPVELIRVAYAALEAAINREDWTIAADALVFLEDACLGIDRLNRRLLPGPSGPPAVAQTERRTAWFPRQK
jgi:hypothetical protein